jgi:hypothetical protein
LEVNDRTSMDECHFRASEGALPISKTVTLVLLPGATRAGIVAPDLGDAALRFRSAATSPGLPMRSEIPKRSQKSSRHVRDHIFAPFGADRFGQHHLVFAVLRKRIIMRIRRPPCSMLTWECDQGGSG